MSYQATTRIDNNPFQHGNVDEESENDDDASQHNIKFTIPPNENNEKGEWNFSREKIYEKNSHHSQGRAILFVHLKMI